MRTAPTPRLSRLERLALPNPDPESFRGVDVAVVLPTLNEEGGLATTFRQIAFGPLLAAGWRIRPLVVDGGSTDRTLEVARELDIPVLHQRSSGKGGAIRESLAWLRAAGVRHVVVLDADSTYPGEMVGRVLELLRSGAGLVVGVRQPLRDKPVAIRDMIHRAGNAFLNYVAGQVSGHTVLDLCSGFWGLDLQSGADQRLHSVGFEIEAELFLGAYRSGVPVVQIPIPYSDRIGVAKLRAVRDGARIFVTILRRARGRIAYSPVRSQANSSLAREVLSACFVHGGRDLVVIADRSRRVEAQLLMDRMAGTEISASLVLRSTPTEIDAVFPSGATADSGNAMVVTFPPSARPSTAVQPPTELFLRGTNSAIQLLLSEPQWLPRGAAPVKTAGALASHSGGFMFEPKEATITPGRGFLRSLLAAPGIELEMLFMNANGLAGTVIRDPPEVPGIRFSDRGSSVREAERDLATQ
ncbi:MAG: glycosyltransferase family 2 protein [Thermoplasmata archaeon]|nr:glycosyltransferase family 2 protein [Thermoplasmata archaeon]